MPFDPRRGITRVVSGIIIAKIPAGLRESVV
jgi:hypothetical protein